LPGRRDMRLSRRARYSLRMMVAIVRQARDGATVSLGRIATVTNMSRRYMEQLAIALKNASLIVGVSGKGGGYRLTRPASQIKVARIIEAVIGPINIVECVDQPEACRVSKECESRWLFELVNLRIKRTLNEITLAQLAKRNWPPKTVQQLPIGKC